MTRKRDAYTRARDRHKRPRRPAPTDGFLIRDVARLSAIPVRTLRDYVQRGLLRHSELRGTLTRYPRGEVLRLLGALRMKAQTKATWAEIKQKLAPVSELDLSAWLATQDLAPAVATELGIRSVPRNSATSPEAPDGSPLGSAGERWQRTVLLPGLELFLSANASPLVKTAALRILQDNLGR